MGELTSVRPADDQHAGRIEGVFRAAGRDKSAPPPPANFQPTPEQMAGAPR
jgi:hypothetical protein